MNKSILLCLLVAVILAAVVNFSEAKMRRTIQLSEAKYNRAKKDRTFYPEPYKAYSDAYLNLWNVIRGCHAECKHYPAAQVPKCVQNCKARRENRAMSDSFTQSKRYTNFPPLRAKKGNVFYPEPIHPKN